MCMNLFNFLRAQTFKAFQRRLMYLMMIELSSSLASNDGYGEFEVCVTEEHRPLLTYLGLPPRLSGARVTSKSKAILWVIH